MEEKVRSQIYAELQKLTASNSPKVFEMLKTKQSYERLETMIIERIITDNMPPSAIIAHIESELSF